MKKLLAIITIVALTVTSVFAGTNDSRDIKINGSVDSLQYTFTLDYVSSDTTKSTQSLGANNTLQDSFDLSKTSTTGKFIVKRTMGNLNSALNVTVGITTGAFIGAYNGEPEHSTGITPEVNFVSDYENTTPTVAEDKHSGNTVVLIGAGAHLLPANLAAFTFDIKGNENVPAGSFVSTVKVAYTYD
ncbi:MAG: hypothetical protein JJE21_09245 [Spirochaetaceae bacterium]|nr:hypothetical protein [Spirochaetaceae bacterium]